MNLFSLIHSNYFGNVAFYFQSFSALNLPAPLLARVTLSFDCSQHHLVEIAKVTKERDEADEELEAERTAISKLKTMGRELIANHEHQVAQLEGETFRQFSAAETPNTFQKYDTFRSLLCCLTQAFVDCSSRLLQADCPDDMGE